MHQFDMRALALTSRLLVTVCFLFAAAGIAFSQGVPTLSISDVTLREGDPSEGNALSTEFVHITLSAPSTNPVSVTVSTQGDTAQSDVDFAAGSTQVNFAPGQTSQLLTVFTKPDAIVEGTEQFFLNLSNPGNATIARGKATATIIDDDGLVLLTQPSSQRAAALDSVVFTNETFPIINNVNFSSDSRTRISVFATGLKLLPGETASAVTATAESQPLAVEFVGRPAQCAGNDPQFCWLTQVVLKLNDQIPAPGDVNVRISLHGQTSNAVVVAVKPQ